MDYINKYAPNLLILIVVFFAGAFIGVRYFAPALTTSNTTIIKEQPTIVQGETKTETKTQIAYVPKETIIERYIDGTGKEITITKPENTDLDAQIGKSEFNVRLNGKEIQFTKNDDEKFMFDKNKIALNQTSTITFDATVSPTVTDETKRWGIGIGATAVMAWRVRLISRLLVTITWAVGCMAIRRLRRVGCRLGFNFIIF